MESKRNYMWVFATCMCLIVAHHQSGGQEEVIGKKLIENICKERGNTDMCIQVLSSSPDSESADLQELAMIALKAAASNATNILDECKKMIENPALPPKIQQGLADCKENLLDAEGQIQDTVAAILNNDKHDAQVWLKAALAAIDTCDASIPGDDDILSKKSVAFRQLCNIAVAINKAMLLNIKP